MEGEGMLRAGRTTVVLAMMLNLGLAGCDDDEQPPPAPAEAEADDVSSPEGEPTPAASLSPTVSEVPPVIDSVTNRVSYIRFHAEMRADLNEFVSDDEIATVNFTITVVSSINEAREVDYFPVGDNFGEYAGDRSVGGTYLVDPVERKKYLVYRDSDRECVCTELLSELPVGQPVAMFASFPAPPPTTESMTVVIPNFPPFKDVPVTREGV
jgi:hypothetical protein